MLILGYIASAMMGVTLGMVGAGGSIMVVPILVYLFQISPLLATTMSLFIVGLTALVGAVNYIRKGEVKIKEALYFLIPSFVGVYLFRVIILPMIPQTIMSFGDLILTKPLLIMLLFSGLMLAASWSMIGRNKKAPESLGSPSFGNRMLKNSIAGFFVGGITSFIGAGGGFLIIPSLVVLLGLKMREAVGTSLIIIACNSLFGFVSSYHKANGVMDWQQMLIVTALAMLGIILGARLSKRVSDSYLKKGFGYFVLGMGTLILFDQIRHL